MGEVYHPMVEPGTGRVALEALFPEWRAGRDFASSALPFLFKMLLRREFFSPQDRSTLNPEAKDLFLADPAAFADRAAECANRSLSEVQDGCQFMFQFANWPADALDGIVETLRGVEP